MTTYLRSVPAILCLALAACTLPTKLGGLAPDDDDDDADPVTVTTAMDPTTSGGGDTTAVLGESDESGPAGSSSSTGPDAVCQDVQLIRKPLRPNVVLVLDKSGSMVAEPVGQWDHDGDPNTPDVTRWFSLHSVVDAVLTEFEDAIDFGAHLYPGPLAKAEYTEEACVIDPEIDIAVAASNKAAILAGIPAADALTLDGGTPVTAAITVALEHLATLDPEVPQALLLVTDGAANCGAGLDPTPLFEDYDESVHTVVADAFAAGVPTYVVGVAVEDITSDMVQDGFPDNTNSFERLNELAIQGGKPRDDPNEKFYNADDQAELAAALDQIAFDALTCIIPFDEPLAFPEQTVVVVDGVAVPHLDDCAGLDGWSFLAPDGPFNAIQLCGSACASLKVVGEASITVCTAV